MDGSRVYCAKWNKSGKDKYYMILLIYGLNLKHWTNKNRNSCRLREQIDGYQRRGAEGRKERGEQDQEVQISSS